eukprot:scaffold20857_cov73-Isochrysis_galbana.AAC.1
MLPRPVLVGRRDVLPPKSWVVVPIHQTLARLPVACGVGAATAEEGAEPGAGGGKQALGQQAGGEGKRQQAGEQARGCVGHHVFEVEVEQVEGRLLVEL